MTYEELKGIMLSESNQTERQILYDPTMWNLTKTKNKNRCLFKRGNQALRRAEGPQIQTGEKIANSVMVTIHSIFAPQDFTKQPLPELDSGLLQERFSLPLVRSDTLSLRYAHTSPSGLQTPQYSTCRPHLSLSGSFCDVCPRI